MVFREVSVIEVREVLRAWLAGKGLRKVAGQAGVDRKTARDYVNAALAAGLVRDGGEEQLTDELVGQVVAAVRPARPQGHGAAWEALEGQHAQIVEWVGKDLTVVKIGDLLARRGVLVPHRTLHRYCVERTDYRGRGARETVRVADGEPGVECQIDFARMGLIDDPETGRRRVVHALIFTAVYSRHMFVWLTFATTLEAIVAGCEAAWRFFGGVFKVLVPDNMKPIVAQADAVNPRFTVGWLEYAQARGFVTDPARVRSPQDKPRVERQVQYVRGNFFAGEEFVDLTDAQARAETWCAEKAGQRIHGTICARPAEVFAEQEAAALLPAPEHPYQVPIYAEVNVHRDYHVQVGKALYSAPEHLIGQRVARPRRRRAGQAVPPRAAGQDPPAPAARRPIHRPGRSARREDRLRDARPAAADHRRRRARAQRRHLRRASPRPRPALDEDAAGVPAAGAGQTLRPRADRHRVRAGARPRRRRRRQDRLHARTRHREHPGTGAASSQRRRLGTVRPRPCRVPASHTALADRHRRRRRRAGDPEVTKTVVQDPISPDLKQVLRRLKLGKMLDTLPERLTLAKQQHLSHAAFLELVLADEATRRDTTSAARRAHTAGLDPGMRIDTWDDTAAVRYDHTLWNELTSLRFLDGPHGAVVLGPVGVGKTHLATALGHIAVRRRVSVLMLRADAMFKRLKAARLDNSLEAEMRRLAQVQLLLIDDFALQPLDATETADFYELVVARHHTASTVTTSNREPDEWLTMMSDPLLAQSAVDRLTSTAHELVIEGPSYRRRQKPTRAH